MLDATCNASLVEINATATVAAEEEPILDQSSEEGKPHRPFGSRTTTSDQLDRYGSDWDGRPCAIGSPELSRSGIAKYK